MSRDEGQHCRRDVPRDDAGPYSDGEFTTLIVTRQGLGSSGRVWVTFDGAMKTTFVMVSGETEQLKELLDQATLVR